MSFDISVNSDREFVRPESSADLHGSTTPSPLPNLQQGHEIEEYALSPYSSAERKRTTDDESSASTAEHVATKPSPVAASNAQSLLLEKQIMPEYAPLRRRKKVLWILVFYLPLQIIPWVLTCILNYRPLSVPMYIGQVGQYTPADFQLNQKWQTAIQVFNTISAVLTIPITSLILAQAAVIYAHRRSHVSNLTLRQLFQLADRGWTDPTIVMPEVFGCTGRQENMNKFLTWGFAFITLCAIVRPLEQALVVTESIQALTCNDVFMKPIWARNSSSCLVNPIYDVIAQDPDPSIIQILPLFMLKEVVKSRLIVAGPKETSPYLWTNWTDVDDEETANSWITSHIGPDAISSDPTFWVSSLVNGTTTGVLREHVLRLNSTIACNYISASDVPSPCPGPMPFFTSYQWQSNSSNDDATGNASIRVCVPGDYGQSPWSLSRDAQTISEDLYIDVDTSKFQYVFPTENETIAIPPSFSIHCTAETTRGYFELGNEYNGNIPQPLLSKWPTPWELEHQFNDVEKLDYGYVYPTATDNVTWLSPGFVIPGEAPANYKCQNDTASQPCYLFASGPLTVLAIAVFGNESFFGMARTDPDASAALSICQSMNIPFITQFPNADWSSMNACADILSGLRRPSDTVSLLLNWMGFFETTDIAEGVVGVGVFYANQETLSLSLQSWPDGVRDIYTSKGYTIQKPSVSPVSIIILSTLLLIEVTGLVALAIYILCTPTWTASLNSRTVAQLARSLDDGVLPPPGTLDESSGAIDKTDGVIGLINKEDIHSGRPVQRLALGGMVPIREALKTPRRQKKGGSGGSNHATSV